MRSTLLLQNNISRSDHPHDQVGEGIDGSASELAKIVQMHRQEFDMSLDEALEGLEGIQQILNKLKGECFSVPIPNLAPPVRLKIQRASHHCTRLMTEMILLLQPFPQELQALLPLETQSLSPEVNLSNEKGEKRL